MNLHIASSIVGTALLGAITTNAQDAADTSAYEVLGVDGSGTTNPNKCFRHIMAQLESQIKLPTRFTYRAVGSGTGQKEFLGKNIVNDDGEETNTYQAYNDFGAGDIPISSTDRQAWIDQGIEMVQLPFVLSAVTFFHNIPGVPSGDRGLNMTACLLSEVFSGDISTWDDPKITAINPSLNVAKDYPIFVGRRVLGSSSTYSITHYLHAQCPQSVDKPNGWPADKAASKIVWDPSTNECDGSGLMTACIETNPGAIGYIDAAHGIEAGLTEIRLSNGDGNFLTSQDAGVLGVQDAAKDLSAVPDSADGDFSQVEFYNMPGPKTWPISLVSYVYLRKDISHIKNPARRTLLKAFAEALFDPQYIGLCERYGHIPVPLALKELALRGLYMVEADAPASDEWTWEKKTNPGHGNGDRVISVKRGNFVLYEADRIADDIVPLAEELRQLKLEMASMQLQRATLSSGASAKDAILGLGAILGGAMMLGLF